MNRIASTLSMLSLALMVPTALLAQDECEHTAPREATLPAGGVEQLRLQTGAGSLRVEGRPGLGEVRVRGTACAASRDQLDQIRLVTDHRGGTLHIETEMPEGGWSRGPGARLDLVLEVPAGLALDIEDGSGGIELRDVGAVAVDDGSGGIEIYGAGPVRVEDGSGGIELRDIRGEVWVRDSSGGIDVMGVDGGVTVARDSSGGIRVQGVRGSVLVQRDSSGGIDVADIAGDFVVERDGSGGVHFREVGGQVRVPRSDR